MLHRISLVLWLGSLAALYWLPGEWRAAAGFAATLVFLSLVAWGVFSIRSPFFGRAVLEGRDAPLVALTFDDGPDPDSTPALLDLLARHRAPATFFVVGARARAHPTLVRRLRDEGHEVGNHSEHHSHWLNFSLRRGMRGEIGACQETLRSILGAAPVYYRPPIGLRNPAVHPVCAELGLRVIGWSVRSLDWTGSPEAVVARVLLRIRPGGIVLLHDGGQPRERVLAIVEGILAGLRDRGLRPVTLGELVKVG